MAFPGTCPGQMLISKLLPAKLKKMKDFCGPTDYPSLYLSCIFLPLVVCDLCFPPFSVKTWFNQVPSRIRLLEIVRIITSVSFFLDVFINEFLKIFAICHRRMKNIASCFTYFSSQQSTLFQISNVLCIHLAIHQAEAPSLYFAFAHFDIKWHSSFLLLRSSS